MDELAAPARKVFRGKKGRERGAHGRKRHAKQPRDEGGDASEKDPGEEKEVDESPAQNRAPAEVGDEEVEAPSGLDLEALIDQVSNDRWYGASLVPTSSSSSALSYQWPHLKESPLGFELQALEVELPRNLFDLDLGLLEGALSELPASKLVTGLGDEDLHRLKPGSATPSAGEGGGVKDVGREDGDPGAVSGAGESIARPDPVDDTRNDSSVVDGDEDEDDLDALLAESQPSQIQDVAKGVEDLSVVDEDAELDALLDL